jgi:RNA polymerase sigma-70 factor (ECF subfamily)
MRRLVTRDEQALTDIYDRYAAGVFSLLRRILREEATAEDVLQEVFFNLWQTAERFDPQRGTLRSWLLVMARNRAISCLRQRKAFEIGDGAAIQDTAASPAPLQDAGATHGQLVAKIRSILAGLAPAQSEAFEMAYFEGMTHTEIAQRTGEPLGTIKGRLRSALSALREALQP